MFDYFYPLFRDVSILKQKQRKAHNFKVVSFLSLKFFNIALVIASLLRS